ncbi:hypothetical protein ACRALDRAFT_2016052 [Sodiomyces alcalophilus JCM 7366]|uniref:uncharacterized protein n=1 Tax=Sodiomyces alcalophilus JCM 7366 TaxID=591952 RepID=UPI0039B3A70B
MTKEPAAPLTVPLVQSPPIDSMKEKKTPTVPIVEKSPPMDSAVPTVPVPPQSSHPVTKELAVAAATAPPPAPLVQSPPVHSPTPTPTD